MKHSMTGVDPVQWTRKFEQELIKLRREWVRQINWRVVMAFFDEGDSPSAASTRYSAILDTLHDKNQRRRPSTVLERRRDQS